MQQGQFFKLIFGGVLASMLAACGGGGGGTSTPAASTLSGVAAVGYPIVNGSISARCAAGSTLSTTTDSNGAWQVTLSSTHILPCAVQVSGGTINNVSNTIPYHSIAITPGTVNVTPLTDLMVANLAGTSTPTLWFNGLSTTPGLLTTITQINADTTLSKLRIALNGLIPLNTINPITTAFKATAGNTSDDMLAALQTAMTNRGITYTTLLANAAAALSSPVTDFDLDLASAYMGTTSAGKPTTPIIASFAGTYNLTTDTNIAATISVDSNGNVTSCQVGSIVSCSGSLILNSTTNIASFQISGNDGLSPVDTSASVSGTVNAAGTVAGTYSGNSVSGGPFSGTFNGAQALQYITISGYANAAAQAGDALPGFIQVQRTGSDPCVTPPATPTGLTVTKRQGSYLFNDFYFNPVRPGKAPDYIHYEIRKSTISTVTTTDPMAGLRLFVNGGSEVDSGALGYTAYEFFAVQAINSCGLRSPLSTSVNSPALTTALPTIASMSPSSGPIGTVVTITGSNFSTTLANNTVRFNGTQATVTAATTTSVTVTVPSGATSGTISVATAGGTATSTFIFTVLPSGVSDLCATTAGTYNGAMAMVRSPDGLPATGTMQITLTASCNISMTYAYNGTGPSALASTGTYYPNGTTGCWDVVNNTLYTCHVAIVSGDGDIGLYGDLVSGRIVGTWDYVNWAGGHEQAVGSVQ